jgi:hypothetical protein
VALYELLLPNDMKRALASIENLVIVVDDETATHSVGGARRPWRIDRPEPLYETDGSGTPAQDGR